MIMGQRAKKLPVVSMTTTKEIIIDDHRWGCIEQAYRHPLSSEVREQVRATTQMFLKNAQYEHKAELAKNAHSAIDHLKRSAESFHLKLLGAMRTGKSDAENYGLGLVRKHFVKGWPSEKKEGLTGDNLSDDERLWKEILHEGSNFPSDKLDAI